MMMDELTKKLGKALAAKLDGFKFVKSKRSLIRRFEGGWQAIVIEALPTSKLGFAKLSAHGHIRIDALEMAYAKYNPFLTEKDAKSHPTIVINCDEIITTKSLANEFSTDAHSIELFVNDFAYALMNEVIPWLERYSNEQSLLEGLEVSEPEKWITSDRLTRYPVLLAILSKRGEWEQFDRVAEEFLGYCNKPHALVYKSFAESVINGLKGEKF